MITREQKKNIIELIKKKLAESKLAVLTDFTGLKTSELEDLRSRLREKEFEYVVVKKNLAKLAGFGPLVLQTRPSKEHRVSS